MADIYSIDDDFFDDEEVEVVEQNDDEFYSDATALGLANNDFVLHIKFTGIKPQNRVTINILVSVLKKVERMFKYYVDIANYIDMDENEIIFSVIDDRTNNTRWSWWNDHHGLENANPVRFEYSGLNFYNDIRWSQKNELA